MLSISAVTPSFQLDGQIISSPSWAKDKIYSDDPYVDKVSLSGGQPDPDMTYQHLAVNSRSPAPNPEDVAKNDDQHKKSLSKDEPDRLAKMLQQVLDSKVGLDRKKLEEIEEKIEALTNKEAELTDAEQAQLDILQKQKEQLIKEGMKKLTETA